jgi:hypothetical protein
LADDPNAVDAQSNRATIAQTLAELRGLRDFADARFSDMQRQLERVEPLPVLTAELKAQNLDQEKRIAALESGRHADGEWRRTHLPTILLTIGLLVFAGIKALHGG